LAATISPARRVYQTIAAVHTGIILLIIVGIASAAGTFILQWPSTTPDDMQRAYSPTTLRMLDATGLTDVYHAWWYLVLLGLLATSIVCASVERWPNAWRYYARPHRRTDASFRAALPLHRSYAVSGTAPALDAVERVWRRHGLRFERMVDHDGVSLYAEKNRFAVMAVYVVHASLLLIMLGGVIDGVWGYQGFLSLVPGKPPVDTIETRDGKTRRLSFAVRCDAAGQENYTGKFAGVPKRWWSRLAVVENGRAVKEKEISVNDPLVYRGVRFYQASYGTSGELRRARLGVVDAAGGTVVNQGKIELAAGQSATLPDGSTLTLAKFIPDAYVMDGSVYQRSVDLGNAALRLDVTGKSAREGTKTTWLFRTEDDSGRDAVDLLGDYPGNEKYQLLADLDMAPFTGLQVSHEPGQALVWAGCLLLGFGLILAFYIFHQRYWAVAARGQDGKLLLWVGGASNRKRAAFDLRFRQMADEIEQEPGIGNG
jgi:cytochrome c biogenesis protein